MDAARRAVIADLQAKQERRNAASKEVGQAKAQKNEARARALIAEVSALKTGIPALEAELGKIDKELHDALAEIPNLPANDVPDGADEHGNVQRHRVGVPREASFGQHFEIGEKLGGMDFEAAAKLSGARFVVLKGDVARLSRAIGQFMLDVHTQEHGYLEVAPPLLVRDDAMFGTAQLPKFADDQFEIYGDRRKIELAAKSAALRLESVRLGVEIFDSHQREIWRIFQDGREPSDEQKRRLTELAKSTGEKLDRELSREGAGVKTLEAQGGSFLESELKQALWLIPTAEVPLTNLVRESILAEDELPLRYAALTPCFRAEAGAAGRDTRGMIRQHQFEKVELVSITTPEKSEEEHERLLACAEEVLKRLELPVRTVTLCTGDMGFAAKKTYDIEVWLPGQGAYREISSCSNCGEFQARRMDARYRPGEGKGPAFVHTLNGSGTAVGRALVAVLENYADQGGGVAVPSALVPYMGGRTRIEAAG
jgi:seryl-tRNA synthetase